MIRRGLAELSDWAPDRIDLVDMRDAGFRKRCNRTVGRLAAD